MTFFFGNSSGNLLADRRYDLALEYAGDGDFAAAADLLRQGVEIAPAWPPLHFHLGEACRLLGNINEAQNALQNYLALDPEDRMGAAIKLSLMGAAPTPSALPAAYVRSLFDQYAPKFEKSLVENLSYQTPQHIFEDVVQAYKGPFKNVLDLGCGTGLAAEKFKSNAAAFTGIDIAPAMIEIAKDKKIYESLHVGDIEAFLTHDTHAYDLVLSVDVFVYMGDLANIFALIAQRMEKGGLFAFSVQALENGDWILGADHRYAHASGYVERCACECGLEILSGRDVLLRLDAGKFIHGTVFVCRKP